MKGKCMKNYFLLLFMSLLMLSITASADKHKSVTVYLGNSITLKPMNDLGISHQTPSTMTYTLSDNSAFTVSSNSSAHSYTLTSKKSGSYTFTVKVSVKGSFGSYTYYTMVYTINVTTTIWVSSITISTTYCELQIGEQAQLGISVSPSNATNKTIQWSSSNENIATVNVTGLVTAISAGECTVTASTTDGSNLHVSCKIIVHGPILASNIWLNTAYAELIAGEQLQLSANIEPTNTANPAVTWNSSNTNIAIVDNNGFITAVSPGTCYIIAKTVDGSNLSASCQLQVLGDILYADDAMAVPSGSFVLPIKLRNISSITGLQFELQLPEGVTMAADKTGNYTIWLSERAVDQNINTSKLSNGNYQFVVFSSTSSALKGNEGAIAYITLSVSENLAVGEYPIGVKEIELTKTDGTSLHHKDLTSKLTLTEPIIGDTNGDRKVTITDAVGIVNYILRRTSSVFITKAADVNNDNNITISDAVKIINIVLDK